MEPTALTAEQIAALTPEQIFALISAKDTELQTAAQLLNEQSAKIDKMVQGGTSSSKLSVEVGDATYTIVHGLNYNGTVYSPLMISQNPEIAAALVKSNSSALKKQ